MSARTVTEKAASAREPVEAPSVFVHGGRVLPSVTVDTYNEELRDDEGFVGDRASRRAFHAILADWRDRLKERGEDPFGDIPMEEISKSKLDKLLNAGDPASAGLIGAVHLAPSWVMAGHDAMLAKLIDRAKQEKIKLAPFMGIGCPGLIDEQGSILKRGQNLPGNWEGKSFSLAAALSVHLPRIDGHEIFIQIHNDAVVQGLSEVPNMKDVEHWGVMTIGTGLGNARFTNRE